MSAAAPEGQRTRLPRWLSGLGVAGVPEAIVACALLVFSVVGNADELTWPQTLVEVAIALFAGSAGRWPRMGAIGTGVALAALVALDGGQLPVAALAMYIPVFSAGVRGLARLRNLCSLWYLVITVALSIQITDTVPDALQSVMVLGALMLAAWGAGRSIGKLRRASEAAEEHRVSSLQSQRRSIARDLHDTVAYATTTMIMRAEEIKLRTDDDPRLIEDLDFIIATGRRSVRDLRGMLEALRRNDPAFDAEVDGSPWRVVSVHEVIESRQRELAEHGLDLTARVETDVDALPESVRETVAKLVVEATSNMVKHAAPGPCRLIIDVTHDQLEAVFTNRVHPGEPQASGSGLGLLGAAERVEALGGELVATTASGTWILRAQLPISGE